MQVRIAAAVMILGACARAPLGVLDDEAGTSTRVRLPTAAPMHRVAEAPAADSGKLSLAEAYQLALRRSEQVAITEAQIESERLARRGVRDELLPAATVTGSAVVQRETLTKGDTIRDNHQMLVEGSIRQPLFRRGTLKSLDAGDRGIEAAREANAREQETLAHDVAVVFIGVLRARRLVELAALAVERTQGQLDNANARVKAGSALKNAELQARLDFKRAAQQVVTAKRDVVIAEAQFARIVGRAPPAQLVLPPEPSLPTPGQGQEQARKRADLRSLERLVAEAREQTEAATARRWWPRVDLVASVSYFDPVFAGPFNLDWSVGGTVTVPLFEANQHTEKAVRENATRIAELQYQQQLQIVDEQVALAVAQVSSSKEAEKLAGEQLEAARELFKLVDKQFKLGAVTYLEITNALGVIVEAENTFEVSRMERISSVYEYLFAIGALDLTAAK